MAHDNPYAVFLQRITTNNNMLNNLKQASAGGNKLTPDQLKTTYKAAHATVTELASFLGIDNAGNEDEAVDQAGLEAYDQAVETCMNITRLSLDLARLHGPKFLIIPD